MKNKEKFIKQIQELDEITQISLMTWIQNTELSLNQAKDKYESVECILREKNNPLLTMLSVTNTKSFDNTSFNQSYTSIDKFDTIMKNSFYEHSDIKFDTNGLK